MHHPEWFKITLPHNKIFYSVGALIKKNSLYTVCEEAKCPNRVKCYTEKRITFLILGRVCTRNCAYCGVAKGIPGEVDAKEPTRIAGLVKTLDLNYVVVTSVTRDDLADHAGHGPAPAVHQPGWKLPDHAVRGPGAAPERAVTPPPDRVLVSPASPTPAPSEAVR